MAQGTKVSGCISLGFLIVPLFGNQCIDPYQLAKHVLDIT